jgi:exonuclease III
MRGGDSLLPNIQAITYNIRSLSSQAVGRKAVERHGKVIATIRRLIKGRDYALFQETWLGKFDVVTLRRDFPGWDFYYSNKARNSAGVLTMIRGTTAAKYTVTEVPLPVAAEGRILALHLRSKASPKDPRASFNLVNIYLSAGQADMSVKEEQINALAALDSSFLTVLGGDCNFVEREADCTGPLGKNCLTGKAKAAWDREVSRLRLVDAGQDVHTRFQCRGQTPTSARLDRFYTSVSPVELSLVSLRSYPVYAGAVRVRCHVTLHERIARGEAVPRVGTLSDHLPVGLDVTARRKQVRGPSDIPAWAADVPGFREGVKTAFGDVDEKENEFVELDRWKAAVRATYKLLVAGKRAVADRYGGQVTRLTRAVGLLHACSRRHPDMDRIAADMRHHGYLEGKVFLKAPVEGDSRWYDTSGLETYIEGL